IVRNRFSRSWKRNSVRTDSGAGERQAGVDGGFERRRSRINQRRAVKSGAQRTGHRRNRAGIGSADRRGLAYEELYTSPGSQPRVRFTQRPDDGTRVAATEVSAAGERRVPWWDRNDQLLCRSEATHREFARSRTRGICLGASAQRIEQRLFIRDRRRQFKPGKGFTRRRNSRNNTRLFSGTADAATARPLFF